MSASQRISVFYDGRSDFLGRTSRILKRLDRGHNLLWLNTAMRKFEPRIYDRTETELSTGVHAQMPDQSWADGPDAIRAACSAVGLGPLVMITQLPGVRQAFNGGYRMLVKAKRS